MRVDGAEEGQLKGHDRRFGALHLTSQQPHERREYSAIGGGVPRTDAELMAEYRDLDVLLVRARSESNRIEQPTNEQQGDRTTHSDDRGRCTAVLVSGRIARLHPSGVRPQRRPRRGPRNPAGRSIAGSGAPDDHVAPAI